MSDPEAERPGLSCGEGIDALREASAAATAETAPSSAREIGPVAPDERVEMVDIVRGLALFGILAANMRGFAGPPGAYGEPSLFWPSMPDRVAQAFVDVFVQGKFVTIFSFLFGAGFAVQFERAGRKGVPIGWLYARRLSILALFGIVHGVLIWFGDILLPYALIGFLLLLVRRRRDSALIAWAIVGPLVPLVIVSAAWWYSRISPGAVAGPSMPTGAGLADQAAIFARGSWSAIQEQRAADAVLHNWALFPVFFMPLFSLFVCGMLAWRRAFFRPSEETIGLYRRWAWIGIVAGLAGNVAATAIRWVVPVPVFPPSVATIAVNAILTVATPMLSLGYVCLVVLLCRSEAWRRRLAHFAPVGRMALTNYLAQSVICTLIFYGYGLGLTGTMGPALLLVPTLLIYATQQRASAWWLKRYRFGPAEWLWRSLTYRRVQPMRLDAAPV